MHRWAGALALVALLAPALPAAAQDYPTQADPRDRLAGRRRPERRLHARGRRRARPASAAAVVVENRAGAAVNIGARACAEAAPDGYTICILSTEAMVINPIIIQITGFDPKKSLAPVTTAVLPEQVFAVNASLGVEELRRARRARQGQARRR